MDTLKTLLLEREKKIKKIKEITDLTEGLIAIKKDLKAMFLSLTPDDLKELVKDEAIVNDLVEYGNVSTCIRLKIGVFKTRSSIKNAIERLLSAWGGAVALNGKMNVKESHRISFSFILVSPK
jgi:hypothetical protein